MRPKKRSLEKVKKLLDFALRKKASDPLVLDLRGVSFWWDYFIIVSALSTPQASAIVEEVISGAKKEGFTLHHKEEDSTKSWILIDFHDVVFHVFLPEKRILYNLEHLWAKAKRLKVEDL